MWKKFCFSESDKTFLLVAVFIWPKYLGIKRINIPSHLKNLIKLINYFSQSKNLIFVCVKHKCMSYVNQTTLIINHHSLIIREKLHTNWRILRCTHSSDCMSLCHFLLLYFMAIVFNHSFPSSFLSSLSVSLFYSFCLCLWLSVTDSCCWDLIHARLCN